MAAARFPSPKDTVRFRGISQVRNHADQAHGQSLPPRRLARALFSHMLRSRP